MYYEKKESKFIYLKYSNNITNKSVDVKNKQSIEIRIPSHVKLKK